MVESVQERGVKTPGGLKAARGVKPQKLSAVKHVESKRLTSGFQEFDRVMGGGIVPGSVTLLAGDPGIGKSTLLLHVIARTGGLYVSGEESAEQIKLRAKRLKIDGKNISVLSDTQSDNVALSVSDQYPLVIIDSIQTMSSENLSGMPGSVGQIRRSAEVLIQTAKQANIPMLIIGHVTKQGTIAGPKVLEHMVDTVLYLEGERFARARILRTLKNRFGAIEEVGIFEMEETGLAEVKNPSKLFLQDRVKNVAGSTVTVIMEGKRPLLVEIQALAVPSQLAMPRRVANGFDYNRLQLLVAILQKRLNVPLGTYDVFVNVSGGLKVGEPAADLAVCMAILSSFKNKPVDSKAVVFGEVGLLGEVRTVTTLDMRTREAKRLGFTSVLSPKTIKNLKQALKYVA